MKTYNVINDSGYNKVFYNLNSAKKAMKENNARGFIIKIRSNGDWIPCGEISLAKSNKTFIANTKQKVANY
jgi:hypothetical protein